MGFNSGLKGLNSESGSYHSVHNRLSSWLLFENIKSMMYIENMILPVIVLLWNLASDLMEQFKWSFYKNGVLRRMSGLKMVAVTRARRKIKNTSHNCYSLLTRVNMCLDLYTSDFSEVFNIVQVFRLTQTFWKGMFSIGRGQNLSLCLLSSLWLDNFQNKIFP
jgi:hypothetical protein